MIVGAAVVELHVHGSQSLKQKRGVVRSIVQRLRNRFNVSVAEIGGQGTWQVAVLGIVSTGNDRKYVRGQLDRALAFVDEQWQKRAGFQLDDVPRQKGHPYSRKKIWYDKETMSPGLAVTYDRGGQVYKLIGGVGQWSESSAVPENRGRQVLLGTGVMIVNVQSGASNLGQFDGMNAMSFPIADSKKYYDTTRLKTLGR